MPQQGGDRVLAERTSAPKVACFLLPVWRVSLPVTHPPSPSTPSSGTHTGLLCKDDRLQAEGGLIAPEAQVLTGVVWPLFYNCGTSETFLRVPRPLTSAVWEQPEEERKDSVYLSPGCTSCVSILPNALELQGTPHLVLQGVLLRTAPNPSGCLKPGACSLWL